MPYGTAYSLANQLIAAAAGSTFIWVVDTEQAYSGPNGTTVWLTKINGFDPAAPVLVNQIDLSAYGGAGKVVKVFGNYVFVGLFPLDAANGNRPGGADSTAPFVIVDATTDAIVGVGSVSTFGDTLRPTDFAFDGTYLYVLAQHTRDAKTTIYKYTVSDVIAAFPSVATNPIAKFAQGNHPSGHFEAITYGGGFLWGTTGQQQVPGVLVRTDTVDGTETVYTDSNVSGKYFAPHYAFGSVWVSGASSPNANQVFRFDPSSFPSAPTSIVVDPSNTISNTCELTHDDTSIWVTNGSNFVSGLPSVWRIDAATNTMIANPGAPGFTGSTQGIAFDGTTIWATLRTAVTPSGVGLLSFSTGIGSEAYIQRFNPSGTFVDPISCATIQNSIPTFFKQPISLTSGTDLSGGTFLWVADMSTSIVHKVNPFLTTPGVVAATDLSEIGVTQTREVRYFNNMVFACGHDSNKIVIIDATTNRIIGNCTLNNRVRSVVIDPSGNDTYWVATITPGTLPSSVYKMSISATLAAYPGDPVPLDRVDLGHHIEQITMFNGLVWMASGGFQNFWATDEYYGGIYASLTGNVLSGLTGMDPSMVGGYLLLSRCGVSTNNAAFPITGYIDPTSVTLGSFHNAPATDGNSGSINWKFIRAQAEPLMRLDPNDLRHGTGASITVSGPNNQTVTISGLSGMTNSDIGKTISITGAAGTGSGGYNNNTFFQILSVTNSTTVLTGLGSHNVGYPPTATFNQPVTDTNNGSLVWALVTSHNTHDTDNGYVWSVFPAFGSIWTSNGYHGVNRWDPGGNYHTNGVGIQPIYPLPTNPIAIISPTSKRYFQCEWASDGTYVWTAAGYGGSGSHAIIRIDPNTNTIIAEVPSDDTAAYADGVAYDGTNIWMTVRSNAQPGLIRFSTGLGTEAQTFRLA